MPRGVYARKSAQPSAAGRKKSAAGGAAKSRKNNSKQAKQTKPPVSTTPASQDGQQAAMQPPKPLQIVSEEFKVPPAFHRNKSVSVDTLAGDELRQYARGLGIPQRDVDALTEDRLRQNCKARIFESMED